MTNELAPVVLFAYNRPTHLKRTLDSLSACRLADRSAIHVFADGARNAAAQEGVAEVRHLLEKEATAARFASFRVYAATTNKGLARSIIEGVGRILDEYDRVIVLEDDLLVSGDFLEFMNACLDFYAEDPAIGSVTGFCPLESVPGNDSSGVFMVNRNSSQGWGTWRRVWAGVDWAAAAAASLDQDLGLRREFNREGNDRYDRLRRQLAGRIDSWSIRFGLSLFVRGLGTVYPAVNRIENIGYDGSGVHSGTGQPKNARIAESSYELGPLRPNRAAQREFNRVYSGALVGRLLRDLLALWPRLSGWVGR